MQKWIIGFLLAAVSLTSFLAYAFFQATTPCSPTPMLDPLQQKTPVSNCEALPELWKNVLTGSCEVRGCGTDTPSEPPGYGWVWKGSLE